MGIASDFVLIVVAGLVGGLLARLLRLPLLGPLLTDSIWLGAMAGLLVDGAVARACPAEVLQSFFCDPSPSFTLTRAKPGAAGRNPC